MFWLNNNFEESFTPDISYLFNRNQDNDEILKKWSFQNRRRNIILEQKSQNPKLFIKKKSNLNRSLTKHLRSSSMLETILRGY